ncbi:MAG: GNAT family N-acetyltransferase [Verrucomicrobiales bacterium]
MKTSLAIRSLTADDLGFADEVRVAAGWNQTRIDWKRLLALNPQGCFVAEWEGVPVGTVTTTCFGDSSAWIGMVLVRPNFRKKGVATDLLKHAIKYLKGRKIKCIKLDAATQGQAVYKKLGFKPLWRLHRWEWKGSREDLMRHRVPRDIFLRELDTRDLPKVMELDREVFGVDRSRLINALLADAVRSTVWDLYSDIESYGMIRPGAEADYLGPVVSTSEHHAHIVIRDLISRSSSEHIYWDIPDSNKKAREIAVSIGFEKVRPLLRMCAGRDSGAGIPESQYAITDPSTG